MKLRKFLLSSFLVSGSFAITAYVLLASALEDPNDLIQRRGVLYLALLPYFFGALINKDGYWERPETLEELLYPSEKKKKSRVFSRILHVVLALALVGAGIVTYQAWGSEAVKGILLILLGAVWGGTITRAWFIYQEGQTVASRRSGETS